MVIISGVPIFRIFTVLLAAASALAKSLKFSVRVYYLTGKALSGELSCWQPGFEVIKLFSCSTQLSMKFSLLINVKMPTVVGILTFMRGKYSLKKAEFLDIFILMNI